MNHAHDVCTTGIVMHGLHDYDLKFIFWKGNYIIKYFEFEVLQHFDYVWSYSMIYDEILRFYLRAIGRFVSDICILSKLIWCICTLSKLIWYSCTMIRRFTVY